MLAESPYRHELESDVEPFRSIFLGLFFLSVGMLLDLPIIAERPLFVVGIAAAVIVIKAVLIGGAGAAVRQQLAAQRPARPAAQPGGRIRLRPVRPGDGGAADPARGIVPVRRGRDPVDGRDAVPDAADRLARAPRQEQRRRSRRAGILARNQCHRRRLRPLRADRRADAAGQADPGDDHRQQAVARSSSARSSGPRSIMATARGSICSGPRARKPPRRSCSARTGGT